MYPGTVFWLEQWVWHPFPDDGLGAFVVYYLIRIVSVVDLPLTLVADTILLPWDLTDGSSDSSAEHE